MTPSPDDASPPPEPLSEAQLAVRMLELAAGFHAAQGDPVAWQTALDASRDWLQCDSPSALDPNEPVTPKRVLGMAEELARCAAEGTASCGGNFVDPETAHRLCRALAPHLQLSVLAFRKSFQTRLFDRRLPTWIVDREGRVLSASHSAQALTTADQHFGLDQGRLKPRFHGAAMRLWAMLPELQTDALFTLPHPSGSMTTLRLRPHPDDDAIIITLLDDADNTVDTATQLASLLGLTPRQSELAAHLLAGLSLAAAARAMEISRDTAKDHFTALRQKTGSADRPELIATLRRSLHGG